MAEELCGTAGLALVFAAGRGNEVLCGSRVGEEIWAVEVKDSAAAAVEAKRGPDEAPLPLYSYRCSADTSEGAGAA